MGCVVFWSTKFCFRRLTQLTSPIVFRNPKDVSLYDADGSSSAYRFGEDTGHSEEQDPWQCGVLVWVDDGLPFALRRVLRVLKDRKGKDWPSLSPEDLGLAVCEGRSSLNHNSNHLSIQ